MGILKNIFWDGADKNTIVYKFDVKNDQVNRGSALTVKEGQAAIFCHQGKMADVFLPGFYKLDTNSIPLLTKLLSWKYGFENAVRVDIYFVNTHQFINQRWGTVNPIPLRDKDFGSVEIRGYGTYAFKVDDPYVFMQELSGSHSTFRTNEIVDTMRSRLISGITQALGQSKIPFFDMAGNLLELAKETVNFMQPSFKSIGINLTNFTFENFSMPDNIKAAVDRQRELNIARSTMDVEMARAQMDVMKTAAGNQGAGGMMGNMMGMGMGVAMGNQMGNMMGNMMPGIQNFQGGGVQPGASGSSAKAPCPKCGKMINAGAKFCPECGQATGDVCPKCKASVAPNAKFCGGCGQALQMNCPKCGVSVAPGTKFCGDCGAKI